MEKRPEVRIKGLTYLLDAFRMHYLCLDESWNYSDTFFSGIENVLKKGKAQDQTLAAECLAVFAFQFDSQNIVECYARFLPILDSALRDVTSPCAFRAACSVALAVFHFLTGHCEFVAPKDLMKSLESIFRGSCLKGDGKAPVLDPIVSAFHVSALRSWGLLYTLLASYDAGPVGTALLPVVISLLQCTNVDMRIMAGEIAALIYERIRAEVDERFKGPYYTDLVRLLNELATDGTKSRSKVDRKRQRQSFRELVDTVTHLDTAETTVNFGSEVLVLTSCTDHFYYDLLCCLLKGGMTRHLQENFQVRDLFDLGFPVVVSHSPLDRRALRDQRRLANLFACKLRTQKRGSHRDRRSNVVHQGDY
ncbi:interferon-related developmental regulator 1 [Clonorchis sinensis]|nr:interferon-related developmental regulator 1 [Clonorchis sinensis]